MHAHRGTSRPAVAVVGGESLMGKEVRDVLESGDLKAEIKLITADDRRGHDHHARPGRAVVDAVRSRRPTWTKRASWCWPDRAIRAARLTNRSARRTPAPVVIDVSGALEERPETRLRAPMVEPAGYQVSSAIHEIAHPAAIAVGAVADPSSESQAAAGRRDQHLRAGERARPGGHRRAAEADRGPAVVQAAGERSVRRAGELQHAGAIWVGIARTRWARSS